MLYVGLPDHGLAKQLVFVLILDGCRLDRELSEFLRHWCRKRNPNMGWGCGQQGVLWQGSVVDFISFISRLKYWGVGQYYDEVVESLGVLF